MVLYLHSTSEWFQSNTLTLHFIVRLGMVTYLLSTSEWFQSNPLKLHITGRATAVYVLTICISLNDHPLITNKARFRKVKNCERLCNYFNCETCMWNGFYIQPIMLYKSLIHNLKCTYGICNQ